MGIKIVILAIIIVILIVVLMKYVIDSNENFNGRFGCRRRGACEFNPMCLDGKNRSVSMCDGSPGVCIKNGLACHSFMNYQ